jgi:iron complex transport system permease protein
MLLILTGMVVGSLFAAGISVIKFTADPYDTLPAITFWLMGGLSYITASDLAVQLVPMALGAVPMLLLGWRLNVLSFGDEEASALGVNVRVLRMVYITGATLLTSAAVSVGGMIGWVGLIIPHTARLLTGADHKRLLPVSALLGAGFLLIVDDLARSLFDQELPLGILTSIAGAPVFLYLLTRSSK